MQHCCLADKASFYLRCQVSGAPLAIVFWYFIDATSLKSDTSLNQNIQRSPSAAVNTSFKSGAFRPPMFPAFAQNLDKCLVPESHSIVTTLCPGPRESAVFAAATPRIK